MMSHTTGPPPPTGQDLQISLTSPCCKHEEVAKAFASSSRAERQSLKSSKLLLPLWLCLCHLLSHTFLCNLVSWIASTLGYYRSVCFKRLYLHHPVTHLPIVECEVLAALLRRSHPLSPRPPEKILLSFESFVAIYIYHLLLNLCRAYFCLSDSVTILTFFVDVQAS